MDMTAGVYSLLRFHPEVCFGRPVATVIQRSLPISSAPAIKSAAIVFSRSDRCASQSKWPQMPAYRRKSGLNNIVAASYA
jgi:hypothetical protein